MNLTSAPPTSAGQMRMLVLAVCLTMSVASGCGADPEPPLKPETSTPTQARGDSAGRDGESTSEIEAARSEEEATGDIRGIVRNASGEPLAMANAAIMSVRMGAATSDDGSFVLRDVPTGTHTLTVSHGGMRHEVDVDVAADSVATVEVTIGNSPEH